MNSQVQLERPLPHSEIAERGILGAILIGNKETASVVDRLAPADFFLAQHRRIFTAVKQLAEVVKPIDLLSVHEALSQAGELEAAGGIAYLAQLGDGVPRNENLEFYA